MAKKLKLSIILISSGLIGQILLTNVIYKTANRSSSPEDDPLPQRSGRQQYEDYLKHAATRQVTIPVTVGDDPRTEATSVTKPKTETKPLDTSKAEGQGHLQKETRLRESELLKILKEKLAEVSPKDIYDGNVTHTCGKAEIEANGCGSKSCRYNKRLSKFPEDRLAQLVSNPDLQLTAEQEDALHSFSLQVNDTYDVTFVTGASSNHYTEVQAALQAMHTYFKTELKYQMVFIDIGLSPRELQMTRKYCNCTVISFPFEKFPPHVSNLLCYGWKPLVVYALIRRTNLLVWMDASIRMFEKGNEVMLKNLELARDRGVQQKGGGGGLASYTLPETFHYFGDEPCAYKPYPMVSANFGIYHNEPLVKQAILAPWAACALRAKCMCPVKNPMKVLYCNIKSDVYGQCHRFDQSVMSIILAKLYERSVRRLEMPDGATMCLRGRTANYFQQLAAEEESTRKLRQRKH